MLLSAEFFDPLLPISWSVDSVLLSAEFLGSFSLNNLNCGLLLSCVVG